MRLDRFQRLALATTAATYLLIAVGGLVRAAGAGLGCPDWPKCFDRWIPPTHVSQVPSTIDPALFNFAKAWTEYVNRLIGVTVGILIFATLVFAIRHYRKTPRVLYPTIASFLLVGFEGWLGGQVVRSQLKPAILTVHLVFALVIVSLLLYATVSAFFPGGRPREVLPASRRTLGRAALGVNFVVLLQVAIGAAVRGEVQLASQAGLPRAEWIVSAGLLHGVHKSFAVLVTLAVVALAWVVFEKMAPDRWLRGTAAFAVLMVVGQVGAGLGLDYFDVPAALQVVHLWLGTLLIGALTVLWMIAYRLDPRVAFQAGPLSPLSPTAPGP